MITENKKIKQVGRKPKADPCRHRLAINLNDADFARFLTLFEQSELQNRAHFITACIFNRTLKVVKLDKAAMDYYMRLTTFHSQFRAIGTNYNQVVKHLKATFTEKMALILLGKLERATMKLVIFQQKIIDLTAEFERKHLNHP